MAQLSYTEREIERHLGPAYFQRGFHYHRGGRVRNMTWEGNAIRGDVFGSAPDPYETIITLNSHGRIADSECSCPIGYACKHVGALALAARVRFLSKESEPLWKEQLRQILKKKAEGNDRLQILLRLRPNPSFGYGSSRDRARWEFLLRPRVFDAGKGKPTLSKVTWRHARSSRETESLPPPQQRYLRQLADAVGDGWYRGDGGMWLPPQKGKEEYLWHLLRSHGEYGVALLSGEKGHFPALIGNEPFTVMLDAGKRGASLVLTPKFSLDAESFDQAKVVFIGDPPVFGMIVPSDDERKCADLPLRLHPMEGTDVRLQDLPEKLVIPGTQEEVFLRDFAPALLRAIPVRGATDIPLPKTIPPLLHLHLDREGETGIRLRWHVRYGDHRLPLDHAEQSVGSGTDAMLCDKGAEEECMARVGNALRAFPVLWTDGERRMLRSSAPLQEWDAAQFLRDGLPAIAGAGVTVETAGDVPSFRELPEPPEVRFSVRESDGDWFNLDITVTIGAASLPFPLVLSALSQGKDRFFLPDGAYCSLRHPELQKLRDLLMEAKKLREPTPTGLSISRFQASLWEELCALGVVSAQSGEWQSAMRGLLDFKGIPGARIPPALKATLRPYQREGYRWLQFLYEHGLGGILGDDMGLGKTVQAIALMCAARKNGKGPHLVVAPTSVVENWESELRRFAPKISVVTLRSGDRSALHKRMASADVVVTSYALLVRDLARMRKESFDALFLDEAQMVKNHHSKAYAAIRQLPFSARFALTGTPMENNTLELWALSSIVCPGLFGTPEQFREDYQKPIEQAGDGEALQRLRSRIRPFLLRRNKELIAKELPPKIEQVLRLEMESGQRRVYDLHLQRERQRILGLLAEEDGLRQHRFEIFRSLMKLRQLCLHPVLVSEEYADTPSTKLSVLGERLEEILAEGHRVLVFSQFTSFLTHVRPLLAEKNIRFSYLDGSTKDRKSVIASFRGDSSVPVFLLSLRAGGFGLNLIEADYCIVLDPWWNPAVERQAVDRAHRIGQKRQVFVYKFIMRESIEEKVLKLQEKKKGLFQSVFDDEKKFASQITEADIREMLG